MRAQDGACSSVILEGFTSNLLQDTDLGFLSGFPPFILANSGIVSTLSTLATVPTMLSELHPSLYTFCELLRASVHELQIKYYFTVS